MTQHAFGQTHLHKMQRIILFGFLAVAAALVFWSVVRREAILARDDNPRLVEAELRIQRGRILDKHGIVLAETVGEPDSLVRSYPFPGIGPVVGYYSFRHGTAGIESGFDSVLRGENETITAVLNREILHSPQIGRDVQITLDANLQALAEASFGEAQGGLVLLEVASGNVLAMVSHPNYDPNLLDEIFDELVADEAAPLLNRAVQGQYQPGLVLQPFILAAAVDDGWVAFDGAVQNSNRPVSINGETKRCQTTPPDNATWADVLRHRCPGPMQELANMMGVAGLDNTFLRFGLAVQPDLPLNTETPDVEPLNDARQAGIGQDNLTVSPLQVALALAALGNNGQVPNPQLVTAVQDENGVMRPFMHESVADAAIAGRTARDVGQLLINEDGQLNFVVSALSGPDSRNGWYLALVPANAPQYALVIVLENSEDLTAVQEIGRKLETAVGGQK